MKDALTLGRRSLLAGLASVALLPSLPALADTPQLTPGSPIMGTLSGSAVSSSFVPPGFPNGSMFSLSATFAAGVTGSVTVERSFDGGSTWSAFSSGLRVISSLTSTGIRNFQETASGTLYRLRAQGLTGNVAYTFSWGDLYRDTLLVSGTFASAAVSKTFADQAAGLCIYAGQGAGTTNTGTISVTRSTDGGATWSTFQAAKSRPFALSILPGSNPAQYRLEASVSSGSFPYEVRSGSYRDAEMIGPGVQNPVGLHLVSQDGPSGTFTFASRCGVFHQTPTGFVDNPYGRIVMSAAQLQQLFDLRWTPLGDADLAGDLTFYKLCKGNTFAKLLAPAAARRGRGAESYVGGFRTIRAEYVNVLTVFDGNGNALSQASSILDPSTIYKPGTQVTCRDFFADLWGSAWAGDFAEQHYLPGIHGYPTLLEAAASGGISMEAYGQPMNYPDPNLTALGL